MEFELQDLLSPRLTTVSLTDAQVVPASFAPGGIGMLPPASEL